jgi:hypothetical protein
MNDSKPSYPKVGCGKDATGIVVMRDRKSPDFKSTSLANGHKCGDACHECSSDEVYALYGCSGDCMANSGVVW